ncbi:MAG TPA: iron ABC transporter permease [bacterium]|nr:iron ABC transporter permease [bacterium]
MAFPTVTDAAGARRPGALRRSLLLVGGIAIGTLALLIVYPTATLVLQSVLVNGRFSLDHYARIAADGSTYTALANSLVVSAWATAGATGLGVILAWLVSRTDLPGRELWRTALAIPYMIPPFIGAIAWVDLLNPVGYLNQAWMAFTGSPDPLAVIYGRNGIIFVMILYEYPIAYLATLGVLQRMSPALEEAGRMARAGPWRVLWDVTVPLALPGILAGALLVLMASLGNFGIPAIIGFPARYVVLTTKIYSLILNFDQPDHLQAAAALSMWLVGLAALVLQAERLALRRGRFATVGAGASTPASLVALGGWRRPATLALAALLTVGVALPLAAILLTSLVRAYGLPPVPANLTLQHYATVLFGVPKVRRALVNSVGLAAGSATLIVVLSVAIAYLLGRGRVVAAGLLDLLITIPYAVPGTIVALAMILAWLRPVPVIGLRLYDTFWLILLAYVARFLVFGVRTALAGLRQIHGSLDEAARISGAGPLEAFRDVGLPLIRPSLVSGWSLAFIPAVAELTLSILLFSVGNETLGVVIFGLHDEGKIAPSAALAVLVTGLLIGINLLTRVPLADRLKV